MRKKRILMVGEHHVAKSGFGLYTREILKRLHDTGKYELAELSCFNPGITKSQVPWKVYPNAVVPENEHHQQYMQDGENVFGKWRFDQTVLHFKPDIVFDIRDFWMLSFQEISILRPYFHWVIAPTVDSVPQQYNWLQTFSNADVVLAHTDWAIDYLKNTTHKINAVTSVSDSVDTEVFRPIGFSHRLNRAQHLVPDNAFIIGSVMRNQKRKLIPNLFDIVKKLRLLSKNTNVYLHLHTSYPEKSGWDIPSLLLEYEAYDSVLFTYYCSSCKKAYASHWKGSSAVCPFCANKTSGLPNVMNGLTDNQLKNIYNLFDVYVQYAICEGLGIPQLEAASCGIPIFSVDYSAMSEVTTKLNGGKIPYALFKELETGALRAVPDDTDTIKQLYKYMDLTTEQQQQNKTNIRNKIIEHYSWDKTTEKYIEIFDKLEPKNQWNTPLEINPAFQMPPNLSNRDFITTIVKDIIKSPHLLNTTFIQNMVRFVDEGFVCSGNNLHPYTRDNARKILENLLNHKVVLEKIRSGQIADTSDFLKH